MALLVKPSSDKVETPRVSVQWLRKHQYITHDYSLEKLYTRGRQDAGRAAVRAADPLTHRDREAQLEAIERGFEAAKRPPVHATNPKLTAVEVRGAFPLSRRAPPLTPRARRCWTCCRRWSCGAAASTT